MGINILDGWNDLLQDDTILNSSKYLWLYDNINKINTEIENYNNNSDISGIEPSIYDKTIYVPINSWFSMLNSSALPLICMQYDNLKIEFIFRAIVELFTIKDIE